MIESNSVRRALSRVRDEMSPTRDDKARLRARILLAPAALLGAESVGHDAQAASIQSVSAGQGVAAPAAAATSLTRWAALKAAGSVGAALGLTLLGVGGGMGFWLGHETASARARSVAAAELATQAASAPAPVLEHAAAVPVGSAPAASNDAVASVASPPVAASEASRGIDWRRSDAPPRAHSRPRAQPNPLNDELALLRRVERALRNNDPALARALLGELDERFPDSRLGEERAAARRIADCRSAEPGASESARAFLREHGASVYRKRIVLACALDAEPAAAPRAAERGLEPAPMKNAESADTHVR